ncbi:MAG TPA: lysophospholipid acyltransferase family protein, partial [Burkholderiaceae bacterium]|nr:lysophospholipid acyltransferase family protein [Burkholderiaceae bacterium]
MIATAVARAVDVLCSPGVEWRCGPYSDAQRIYFANHTSHLDFVVIWTALPPSRRSRARPVADRRYWEQSSVRRELARHVFNAVLVDRGCASSTSTREAARATTAHICEAMGDRHSLILFPEGTRSLTGEVGAFKSGLYFLARCRPDVELIPVHVWNLGRILPKGEWLP